MSPPVLGLTIGCPLNQRRVVADGKYINDLLGETKIAKSVVYSLRAQLVERPCLSLLRLSPIKVADNSDILTG